MKKIIVLLALFLPALISAQEKRPQPLSSERAGYLGNFVQINLIDNGLNFKIAYDLTYVGDGEYDVVKDQKGKNYKFGSVSEAFNYLYDQGYDFFIEVNVQELKEIKSEYLFRKRIE